jgi:hypothetical protein
MSDMSSGSPFAVLDMQGADMQPLSPVHLLTVLPMFLRQKRPLPMVRGG